MFATFESSLEHRDERRRCVAAEFPSQAVVSFRLQISQACRMLDRRPWKLACNDHFEHRGDDAHEVLQPCFSLSFELPTGELQVPKSRGAGDERETLVMDHRVNDSRNKSTMWFLMVL